MRVNTGCFEMIPLRPQDVKQSWNIMQEKSPDDQTQWVELSRLKEAIEGLRKEWISQISEHIINQMDGSVKPLSIMEITDLHKKIQDKWFGGVLK